MTRFPLTWPSSRCSLVALMSMLVAACASSTPAAPRAKSATGERDTAIVHEPCDKDSASAEKVDVNGDGVPDIIHVKKDGREVCRVVDLNLDGAIDAFIYYDATGAERRRESDFDRDGRDNLWCPRLRSPRWSRCMARRRAASPRSRRCF